MKITALFMTAVLAMMLVFALLSPASDIKDAIKVLRWRKKDFFQLGP